MTISIDGLVSGLDTESVIEGLLEIQQQQIDRLEVRKSEVLAKKTAFKTLEAKILAFRSQLGQLTRIANNPFQKQTVAVSNDLAAAATASADAVPGVYQFTVDALARPHQVATQGFADADAEITQGTLDIRVGGGELKTVTVDANNNTLSGLAAAINAADAGVSATVINDANGGATPYRLLLAASETGAANTISLTNNFAAGSGSATQVTFDTGNPVQEAQDARITLGSGAGAITVASSTNRFEDVVAGLRIDLLQPSIGEQVSLTVNRDTEAAVDAVSGFVEAFNDVMAFIDAASSYDSASDKAGVLLGNRSAATVQQRMRSAILSVVPGVNSSANRLSSIGISVSDQGRLVLNQAELEDAVNGRIDGVTGADLRRLFALNAEPNRNGVRFLLGSAATKANGKTVEIDLTQAAEQARITGGTDLAESTVIDATNDTLELALDGVTSTITLTQGTYTRQELADHLEAIINGVSAFGSREARVTLSGNQLQIASESYGTQSEIRTVSGSAVATLGFTDGQSDTGQNVAGTFLVDGETESVTGNGRILSGTPDNEWTADLQFEIRLNASQITEGPEASAWVTRGVAATMDELLDGLLDAEGGLIDTVDQSFDDQVASLQSSIDRQKAVFDQQQESLIKEFIALERAISELNSTSSLLSTQLAGLNNLTAANSRS